MSDINEAMLIGYCEAQKDASYVVDNLNMQIEQLKKERDILLEAVRFYANKEWGITAQQALKLINMPKTE